LFSLSRVNILSTYWNFRRSGLASAAKKVLNASAFKCTQHMVSGSHRICDGGYTMLAAARMPVWLICGNALIREGLRRILEENGFEVRRLLNQNYSEVANDVDDFEPGERLLIIDCCTSGEDLDRLAKLRKSLPSARLVVLSNAFQLERVISAFRVGVDGYMLNEIGCDSLIESLRLVCAGEKVLPSELIKHLTSFAPPPCAVGGLDANVTKLLSDREIETLRCLIQGFPNKVIAHNLGISEATVKVHVKAILRKLMVQNRTQAAIWAVNRGMDGSAQDDLEEVHHSADWPELNAETDMPVRIAACAVA